jgi:hypothetical protein
MVVENGCKILVMEKIKEALEYAVNNTHLFSMKYKGGQEFNIEGVYYKMKEFLDAQTN